jgi:hypothetical protein
MSTDTTARRIPRRRTTAKLLVAAALATASIMLVLPVTAGAAAKPEPSQNCVFYVGGGVYGGTGTEIVTPSGQFILTCQLSLTSGAGVDRVTRATVGNCELLLTPNGQARASCRFKL